MSDVSFESVVVVKKQLPLTQNHAAHALSAGVPGIDVLPESTLPAMDPGFHEKEEAKESGDVSSIKEDEKPEGGASERPKVGDLVEGRVDLGMKDWVPPCLMVRLDGGCIGRVCVTEITEVPEWTTDPLSRCVLAGCCLACVKV